MTGPSAENAKKIAKYSGGSAVETFSSEKKRCVSLSVSYQTLKMVFAKKEIFGDIVVLCACITP